MFQFVDAGGGYYRLRARHSGKVADVYGAPTANGAQVVQWSDNGGTKGQQRRDLDQRHQPRGSGPQQPRPDQDR
jgi:hypothetical protein